MTLVCSDCFGWRVTELTRTSYTQSMPISCVSSPRYLNLQPDVRVPVLVRFPASAAGGSIGPASSGIKASALLFTPAWKSGFRSNKTTMARVIPFNSSGVADEPPPDLASYLLKNRIVFLGMSLVPSVTELVLAEFLHLQFEDPEKPIYLYINSTGTTKGDGKLGYEREVLAIYDTMSYIKPPVFTLCVGNAWGEAALLLASGSKGNRAALPSSVIMIRQPFARFQGQASEVDNARNELKKTKADLVGLFAEHTGKTKEQIEADISRPKYFTPNEAVEYGIIDKVLYNENRTQDHSVASALRKAQLL